MIKMPVRQQDAGRYQVLTLKHLLNSVDISARINHDSLARLFAPEDTAVLQEGCYGNNGMAHGET
jgi:hypothetical protein